MTDKNKTALEEHGHVPDAPKEDTRSGAQKAKDRKKQQDTAKISDTSTISKTILGAAVVLSVASLATSGWLFYQAQHNNTVSQLDALKNRQNNIADQLNAYNQSRAEIRQLSDDVKTTAQQLQQKSAGLVNQQEQQSAQIQHISQQLNRLHNTTKEDWKLAEAEYLVRLANQRILLESDAKGSEGLLASADSILAELQDPMFFKARKAIAEDIQALKSTRHFDLQGRYLELDALYSQVSKLPQREPSKQWQQNNQTTSSEAKKSVMNKVTGVFGEMWQSLKSLVVINYDHKPIKALLPPTEYQQLVTGLQLQIDVAQVAMVKGDPAIYQKALSRVANAVTGHFDTDSQRVIAFLSSITALQQVNPAPKLPLPHRSLEAMKSLMADWNTRAHQLENQPYKKTTDTKKADTEKTDAKKSAPQEDKKTQGDQA